MFTVPQGARLAAATADADAAPPVAAGAEVDGVGVGPPPHADRMMANVPIKAAAGDNVLRCRLMSPPFTIAPPLAGGPERGSGPSIRIRTCQPIILPPG